MGGKFLETSRGICATSDQTVKTRLVLARKTLDCQRQLIQAWQPAVRQLEQGSAMKSYSGTGSLLEDPGNTAGRSWSLDSLTGPCTLSKFFASWTRRTACTSWRPRRMVGRWWRLLPPAGRQWRHFSLVGTQ